MTSQVIVGGQGMLLRLILVIWHNEAPYLCIKVAIDTRIGLNSFLVA